MKSFINYAKWCMNIMINDSRFFAFGCSFTKYSWPTWADLVAAAMPSKSYFNYGEPGAGNTYIHFSIMYANQKHKITKDDLVIICWSGYTRHDFLKNGDWNRRIQNPGVLPPEWDPKGYLIRDLSLIKSIKEILDMIGCEYYFLSIDDLPNRSIPRNTADDVLTFYEELVELINPSYSSMFGGEWDNMIHYRVNPVYKELLKVDMHPLPEEHYTYISTNLPINLVPDKNLLQSLSEKMDKAFAQYTPNNAPSPWEISSLIDWGIRMGNKTQTRIFVYEGYLV